MVVLAQCRVPDIRPLPLSTQANPCWLSLFLSVIVSHTLFLVGGRFKVYKFTSLSLTFSQVV